MATDPPTRASPATENELSLGRYLERVDGKTGTALPRPLKPSELLIDSHRDHHPVDVHARYMMSRVVRETGSEEEAVVRMRRMRTLAFRLAQGLARLTRHRDPEALAERLFGLQRRHEGFRFKGPGLPAPELESRLRRAHEEAHRQWQGSFRGETPQLRVLLTGGTGFIGQELICQLAGDPAVAEVVVLIRPLPKKDRQTGEILEIVEPARRGQDLLLRLGLAGTPAAEKFRFLAGDIEKPFLGLDRAARLDWGRRLTHVIHCAASVAFDAPYEESFRSNVLGSLHALSLSLEFQRSPQSPFVSHLAIETSYIHGRSLGPMAAENELTFPRGYYNNYYELTKAMASIEAERFFFLEGLRVVQLCPTIVIGQSGTGNNRGDTKVVNAPVNLFGRTSRLTASGSWAERSRLAMLTHLARAFPGDPTAQLNLITVDWVARGIVAALKRPGAVGRRIHLANDQRLTTAEIREILREELGVEIKLVDPTLHRNVGLPLLRRLLAPLGQAKAARTLETMNAVFGGYAEWGQPVHEVGNDVRILGLPAERPDPRAAFRMLCRHNRFVQSFGKVRDPMEIARREQAWTGLLQELEARTGQPSHQLSASEFLQALQGFTPKPDGFEDLDPSGADTGNPRTEGAHSKG